MTLPFGRQVRATFGQLRRDLRMVLRDLRGEHEPPFFPRAAGPYAGAVVSLLSPRRLVVREIVRETADAVTLWLEDASGAPIPFVAGQFMTLLVPGDGGEVLRRAYSASSSPRAPKRIALTVKRVLDGRVSPRIVEHTHVGDAFDALGPSGNFTYTPDPATRRNLVLVAGGSGITPLASILREALEVEPNTTVLLVYANRSRRDIIFAQELDELARVHAGRFTLRHVLGDRFDPLALGTVDPDAVFYVCGPEPMMATVRATLTEKGVSSERLFEERFSHGPKRATSREKRRVRVRMHGAERAFDVPPGSSILEASLAAGVQMPFSCALGGCGACRVKVVAGTVVTDEASCLSDRERADGYALACVASPLEDAILEAG